MSSATQMKLDSYDAVNINNWIVKVSKNKLTNTYCISMIHRYKQKLTIKFTNNEEEANDYIAMMLEKGSNG